MANQTHRPRGREREHRGIGMASGARTPLVHAPRVDVRCRLLVAVAALDRGSVVLGVAIGARARSEGDAGGVTGVAPDLGVRSVRERKRSRARLRVRGRAHRGGHRGARGELRALVAARAAGGGARRIVMACHAVARRLQNQLTVPLPARVTRRTRHLPMYPVREWRERVHGLSWRDECGQHHPRAPEQRGASSRAPRSRVK